MNKTSSLFCGLVISSLSLSGCRAGDGDARRFATKPFLSDDGKTLRYGLYPQTHVYDTKTIESLNKLAKPEKNGWYLYENDYYAKTTAWPFDSEYFFDNLTKIVSGTTYWFRCEPIEWNVLNNNGREYYVVSSVLLDAHNYYSSTSSRTIGGKTIYANNYEHSDIRAWLNEDFYKCAFALGNNNAFSTAVDNSSSTTDDPSNLYACETTYDKVFLPSYKDYTNPDYGFTSSTSFDSARCCKTTDWARARGAHCSTVIGYLFNGCYWTRSPYSCLSYGAQEIWFDGQVLGAFNVCYTTNCVRPAITVKVA